jgi:hypothetical protein
VTDWGTVAPDEAAWNGWVEGPGNHNPWTEELHIGDAAYCAAFATRMPAHHGVDWGPDAQMPHAGIAYSPLFESWGGRRGAWRYDHASRGDPADLQPGDIVTFDWNNDGVADHTETVWQVYADGTFDDIGANTGHPEGVHVPVRRNRSYLLGRCRSNGVIYGVAPGPAPPPAPAPPPPPPAPAPGRAPDGNPHTPLAVDGDFGPASAAALQWKLGVADDGQFGPISKRALQARLGVVVDGVIGPQTVRALQSRVGAGVDGSWGPDTTRHIQATLNAGRF